MQRYFESGLVEDGTEQASELDGSSSDTETEQTDHCARGSEVAKWGGAKAARSHTCQVRLAIPDASVSSMH